MEETIKMSKSEYVDMIDYMERMKETLEVLSNEETIKKLTSAMSRINSGDYLSKEELI